MHRITMFLLFATISISQTCVYFKTAVAMYPKLSVHCEPTASIVHCADYEFADFNLQLKSLAVLTIENRDILRGFMVATSKTYQSEVSNLLLAYFSEQKLCTDINRCKEYIDVRFCYLLPATESAFFQRLIGAAGTIKKQCIQNRFRRPFPSHEQSVMKHRRCNRHSFVTAIHSVSNTTLRCRWPTLQSYVSLLDNGHINSKSVN